MLILAKWSHGGLRLKANGSFVLQKRNLPLYMNTQFQPIAASSAAVLMQFPGVDLPGLPAVFISLRDGWELLLEFWLGRKDLRINSRRAQH